MPLFRKKVPLFNSPPVITEVAKGLAFSNIKNYDLVLDGNCVDLVHLNFQKVS